MEDIYRNKIGISSFGPWRLSLVVSHPRAPILNCFYHLLWFYFLTVSEFSSLAKSCSVSGLTPMPHIPTSTISPKGVHTKCLMLTWKLESVQFSYKIFGIIHL